MLSQEVAIELLDHRHEIRVKASNLNPGVTQAQLSAPTDLGIRIQSPDNDLLDAPRDHALGARDLWAISGGAGL